MKLFQRLAGPAAGLQHTGQQQPGVHPAVFLVALLGQSQGL